MDQKQDSQDENKNIHFWFYALHDLIPNLDYESSSNQAIGEYYYLKLCIF